MIASQSLFDEPSLPVAEGTADWITGLLTGPVATSLCVIAVAVLGMMLLTGRIPIRQGLQVVLGCFLLLGASTIAAGLQAFGDGARGQEAGEVVIVPQDDLARRRPLPPARYDPYAGASLRRD
jgi:type IV secretory pathway VirB2 component (pilin)